MEAALELISIGTELLNGRTLNSHAQALGAALSGMGLRLTRDTTIPDEMETIRSAVSESLARTDLVIVSGGLGPTCDDITREALAGLFGRRIVPSPEGLAALHQRLAARGRASTPAAERQALVLEGARTLVNSCGAAAGQRLDFPESGKILYVFPGPPNEFAAMLSDHLLPQLREMFRDAVPNDLRVLTTQGFGESDIVTRLEAIGFQALDVALGFYPGNGRVEIRLSAPPEHRAALDAAEQTLRELLRDYLV
jgi:nicotinamide-nucleotide amidase